MRTRQPVNLAGATRASSDAAPESAPAAGGRSAEQNLGRNLERNRDFSGRWAWGQAAIGLAVILPLFFWLQFSTPEICCGDFDGYYHIHWSQSLWKAIRHGHLPVFAWLPFTSLNSQQYSDQHFLFHLLLIPFLWLATPVTAAKVSAALFGAAAVFSCFWLVLRYRLRHAVLWLFALLGSSSFFLYRMSMTRAQSISMVLVAAGIFLLFEQRYRWLAVLAFVYVWAYNLFVLLAAMALLWMLALWWSERRREWRPLLWTVLGLAAGLVLNPYFPRDVLLFTENLMAKAGSLSVPPGGGMEWYALPSWELATSSAVAFAAMLAGYLCMGFLTGRYGRSGTERPVFLLLLATLLLLLTARSRRFTEYWPPCAVLFAAFSLETNRDLTGKSRQGTKAGPNAKLKAESGARQAARAGGGKLAAALPGLALAGLALAVFLYQAYQAKLLIAATAPAAPYRGGTEWLSDHVPRGATIFNASWDDFPVLFYYDDAHAYVSGLDPVYLSDRSPQLGALYQRIVSGQETYPGAWIRREFGAEYVFLTPVGTGRSFYVAAILSGQFEKVYEDQHCVVLKIKDSVQ